MDSLVGEGYMVASVFLHWKGLDEDGERKKMFVENFNPQKDWGWGDSVVRMDKPAGFAT